MTETNPSERTVSEILRSIIGGTTVGTVFGPPVDRDGVTLVPVARVRGTGGAGGGDAPAPGGPQAGGSGAGVLYGAKPLGAFVLRDGHVSWRPVVDVNRLALGGQVVGVVALLTAGTVLRRWLAGSGAGRAHGHRHGPACRRRHGAAARHRHGAAARHGHGAAARARAVARRTRG